MEFDRRFTDKRSYNIKQLWSKHHEIIRRVAIGHSNGQIAAALGVTPQTVSNVRNSPVARVKLMELQSQLDETLIEVQNRIRSVAPTAQNLLEDIITGSVPAHISLRAKYASELLNRAGLSPVHRIASVSTTLTRDDIESIKRRAIDAAEAHNAIAPEYKQL
jgi:hypothetical protein